MLDWNGEEYLTGTTDEGIAIAFAVEHDLGATTIIGDSETLSRMTALYDEMGLNCSPAVMMEEYGDGFEFRVTSLMIDASPAEMDDANRFLKIRGEYPVEVWSWKQPADDWETGYEYHRVGSTCENGPLLMVATAYGEAFVFGQYEDIKKLKAMFPASRDKIVARSNQRYLSIDVEQMAGMTQAMEETGHGVFHRLLEGINEGG